MESELDNQDSRGTVVLPCLGFDPGPLCKLQVEESVTLQIDPTVAVYYWNLSLL
jgi:hypothetical protein